MYRDGENANMVNLYGQGYKLSVAYLQANNTNIQVKSWAEDRVADANPNSMDQFAAAAADGKYISEGYAYVGEDGKLNLKVTVPSFIGYGWFIGSTATYAKVTEKPAFLAGDINGDGTITTADAVAIVNIALGEAAPTADQLAVADMNGDGQITTADAVAVVQLALAEEAPAGAPRVDLSAQNRLSVNAGKVMLSNADEFVAFQMDVTLADDAQLQGVNLSNRMTTHEATYARVDANTWRIIVISMQNDAIMNNSGSLMQLNISGNQEISLSNVEFVDAAARGAVGLGVTTGIVGVDADQSDASYYNVGGVRNDNVRKGMNIVRSADGKVKKVLVK